MSERSVQHATIVIERAYGAAPARVFAAWADPAARERWSAPGEGWESSYDTFDFRTGGREVNRFGPPEGPVYVADTRYEDIVPDARIVFAYTVAEGDKRLSASLTTVELLPEGAGTKLILTEQAAFLDEGDKPEFREEGWRTLLEKIGVEVERAGTGD